MKILILNNYFCAAAYRKVTSLACASRQSPVLYRKVTSPAWLFAEDFVFISLRCCLPDHAGGRCATVLWNQN